MKSTGVRSIVLRWFVGTIVGTAVIGVTSPLFVRSYVPLQPDPLRRTWTLAPGHTYRWRSEGYANTHIGPHGMPGRTSVPKRTGESLRIALWGDSQAEGVCVDDRQKLFSQIETIASGELTVLPLTRSGEDAADWVTQIPHVEQPLQIDVHVLLIVDLPDLAAAVDAPLPPPSDTDVAAANAAIAARVPAFVIQAARNLLTEADEVTRRSLRFGIGPVAQTSESAPANSSSLRVDWETPLRALRESTSRAIVILYAPKVPQIVGGRIVRSDPGGDSFAAMKPIAESMGIIVVDARFALREAADEGRWPHGFHNGQIGAGHLNPQGYAIIASALLDAIQRIQPTEP